MSSKVQTRTQKDPEMHSSISKTRTLQNAWTRPRPGYCMVSAVLSCLM